jgi:hypothetical protein
MTNGHRVVHAPDLVARIADEPWEVARALCQALTPSAQLGADVEMIERQPIRPIAGGRSFASSTGPAPLHTDSQLFHGRPPNLQVLGCVRASSSGGESLVLDCHRVLSRIERDDPALFDALFRVPRSFPFVFGDLLCTTLSAVGEELVFTHAPRASDPIGAALLRYFTEPDVVALRPGDILIVDNHRCAHGRTAFDDPTRELQRILIWHPGTSARGTQWSERARRDGHPPERVTDRNVPATHEAEATIVADMLRGVPPGALARRHRIPEAWLYAFRDRAAHLGTRKPR